MHLRQLRRYRLLIREIKKAPCADVMRILKDDGWYIFNIRGSHHQFKHPSKLGKVTVPRPKSDLPTGTVKGIFRQAGIEKEK